MRVSTALTALAVLAAMVVGLATEAQAAEPIAEIVSDNPANFTPDVANGRVRAIAQVGDRIIIGGNFAGISDANGGTSYTRTNIAAFDATTGAVDPAFNPVLNGRVRALVAAADGTSVYVTGNFTTVNGVTERKITRLDVATGTVTAGFNAPAIHAEVRDAKLVDDTLYIAGRFNAVGGQTRTQLASLDATTGELTNEVDLTFAGTHNGGIRVVSKMEVTPAGDRLLAIGNFTSVEGVARDQIAMIDLSGPTATLAPWYTDFYESTCSSSFDTYMRDLDISEDGSYAVISTTGAFFGGVNAGVSCDTISRFPVYTTASNLEADWVNYTGGDTTYAVEIARGVVYAGGHMRWVNNPYSGDSAGPGAIPRDGILAMDPTNGLPFSWDPGRTRGVGVFDFLVTDAGLWAGSDTARWAGEQHRKLALFPFAGGSTLDEYTIGSLANDVYSLSGGNLANDDNVRVRFYDGSNPPGSTVTLTGTESWHLARGGFTVDDTVYTGWSDGGLYRRTFDGNTWGTAASIQLFDNTFEDHLPSISGMFFDPDDNRIYYTLEGSNSLYWRKFTPESDAVGATAFTAGGDVPAMGPSRVQGMFLSNGQLFFADDTTGNLLRVDFDGGIVTGPVTTADTTVDWRTRAMFAWNTAPNQPATAAFTVTCTDLDCDVDATASNDLDGTIVAYDWDFGDTSSGTGVTTSHAYAAANTYTITLTVTDDDGATDATTETITVTEPGSPEVMFRAAASTNLNRVTSNLTVPSAVQEDDTLVLFVTINKDTSIATAPAGWTLLGTIADPKPDTHSWLFTRTAPVAYGGATVSVTLAERAKTDMTLLAYSGAAPVASFAAAEAPSASMTHTTPSLAVTAANSTIVSYWADESSANTGWTLPAEVTERITSIGGGGGRIVSAAGDSGPLGVGTWPGATATSTTTSGRAPSWTVLLTPAP